MTMTPKDTFQPQLVLPELLKADRVPELIDKLLESARQQGVTDVHLVPREASLEVFWRMNGVLHLIAEYPHELKSNIVSRVKVLAELLSYQSEVPQEGRIRTGDEGFEMRVSTFPTLFGEKAVIRLFVGSGEYRDLDSLGYPAAISDQLKQSLHETSGVMLLTGPSGSGKTTTAYACLREIVAGSPFQRSLSTLEDPIEAVIPSASQSQIRPQRGFDYSIALKSLLRQDPEVIMVGEIRDVETAQLVFQAALTGHLVLTTFHSGSAAEAISRLMDMGIEPYQLRSGLLCVLNQRLVRVLCDCSEESRDPEQKLGLDVEQFRVPRGCDQCDGTGYRGRMPIAELLTLERQTVRQAVLENRDSSSVEASAIAEGMKSRWEAAAERIEAGLTSPAEVRRVLGFTRRSE